MVEPAIDPYWQLNNALKQKFLQQFNTLHPGKFKPGESFIQFHARGLTALIGIAGEVIHRFGKTFYVAQSWAADQKGKLLSSTEIRNGSGFDFDGILALEQKQRPDYLAVELIWQEWKDKFNNHTANNIKPVEWTTSVIRQCKRKIRGKAGMIAHVEITPGQTSNPTLKEFKSILRFALKTNGTGVSFYDYRQIKKAGSDLDVIREVYKGPIN